jgi:hypothetical protein
VQTDVDFSVHGCFSLAPPYFAAANLGAGGQPDRRCIPMDGLAEGRPGIASYCSTDSRSPVAATRGVQFETESALRSD